MGDLDITELRSPPDDFLPNEPEGAAFHQAFLASGIAGFDCRYLAISRNGLRIAVVPFFLHTFSLSTMLPEGLLKKLLTRVKLKIACVGHPSTDFGLIDGEISADILALVNTTLEKEAGLVAYKGFADNLPLTGFVRVRGLPVNLLTIRGDYYSELDRRRRKDFRKKRQAANSLRIEEYSTLPAHLLPQVHQLYLNTLAQAPVRFETLTPEYFRQVAELGQFHLYFEGERLIGFLQMITKGSRVSLKYMGMDYLRNRPYYLYFVMCLRALETCMRAGCTEIDLGVSSYQVKRLMGCDLVETSIYFRHTNVLANWLLDKCRFLLEPDERELR